MGRARGHHHPTGLAGFDSVAGGRRGADRPAAPSNRPPRPGDQAVECPNVDCDAVHYFRATGFPDCLCACGEPFNANDATIIGRVRDDGTLDTSRGPYIPETHPSRNPARYARMRAAYARSFAENPPHPDDA